MWDDVDANLHDEARGRNPEGTVRRWPEPVPEPASQANSTCRTSRMIRGQYLGADQLCLARSANAHKYVSGRTRRTLKNGSAASRWKWALRAPMTAAASRNAA